MRRIVALWIVVAVCTATFAAAIPDSQVTAQTEPSDAEATIAALRTTTANQGAKIDELSTKVKSLRTQVADLTTPTPEPRGSARSTDEIVNDYPPLEDVRELAVRPGAMIDERIAFSGTVVSIFTAAPGKVFMLGDTRRRPFDAHLQVDVPAPDGSSEVIFVGYDGDTAGVFEGTYVTVYGTVLDQVTFGNTLGGQVTQPLVGAELVIVA